MGAQESLSRRKSDFDIESNIPRSLIDRISIKLADFQVSDLLTTANHSEDFIETRSDLISGRLQLMVFMFAFLVPLSSILDVFLLQAYQVKYLIVARVVLSISLIYLGLNCRNRTAKAVFHFYLPMAFIFPSLFYVVCRIILATSDGIVESAGYDFMPYLIITMLALFPLTAAYGLSIIALSFVSFVFVEYLYAEIFSSSTFNKLWAFSMFAAVSLWLQSDQLAMLMKLYRESSLDSLTGLVNRRVLMKSFTRDIEQGKTFSVLILDLDKFKRINDTHGHLAGDLVLKTVADLVTGEVRDIDIVSRFGGEEFVIALPNIELKDAAVVAQRIRLKCEETVIIYSDEVEINVTTSIGVTQYHSGETIEATLQRSDELLYLAKSCGRNQIKCE